MLSRGISYLFLCRFGPPWAAHCSTLPLVALVLGKKVVGVHVWHLIWAEAKSGAYKGPYYPQKYHYRRTFTPLFSRHFCIYFDSTLEKKLRFFVTTSTNIKRSPYQRSNRATYQFITHFSTTIYFKTNKSDMGFWGFGVTYSLL